MKFKNILTTLILIFCINISYAQVTLKIGGELIDSTSNSTLPYANVILLKGNNDSVIAGTMTNDNGKFNFSNVILSDSLHLLIQYMGFSNKSIDLTLSHHIDGKIDLGKIYMHSSGIQINELVIEGTPNYVEKKFDRKVFNISGNKTASARTVLDLLRPLPGVIVNEDGTIYYKGAEAIIYVDDQLMKYIFSKIEMIPVEKVDKIELIDVAMRTGGDGRGGIINIKLKSMTSDGLSGMASANLGTVDFSNLNQSRLFFNLNYKHNKITYFINSSLESNLKNTDITSKTDMDIFTIPSLQNSSSSILNKRLVSSNYIGAIYNPSQNTKLYLSYCFLYYPYKTQNNNSFDEYNKTNQDVLNKYSKRENSNNDQLNTGLTLSYWHKFDTIDTYIKVFGNFNMFNGHSNQNSLYQYNVVNSKNIDSSYSYYNKQGFYTKSLYFSTFYNHSITKHTRWNLSYFLTLGIQDSLENLHYINDQVFLPRSQFANNFNQSHNLSFRMGTNLKKWTIDGGVNFSGEFINGNYYRFDLENKDTVIPLNKHYIKILPSATIAYAITDISDIKLTISKTTDFPYFRQLSDYVDKNNLYSWYSGNSELMPVDFYSVYLGYSFNKEKLNASAECFFNYTDNEITNISIPISSLISITKPENISQNSNTGIDLSIWYMLNDKLNFSLSSSIFHSYYNIKSLTNVAEQYNLTMDDLIKRQFGYYIKYSMEWNIKGFYTMFYINYYAKELTFDGYNKGYLNSSFNVSKKFAQNKCRITLGINNIFDDLVEHGSYSNNFGIINNTQVTGDNYKRNYYIAFQYNFRQGDRGTKDLR